MHSICFHIGPLTIRWYGVMMALGFLSALANWNILNRRENKNSSFCPDLLFWIMISGILGARIAYIISDLPYFLKNPSEIIRIDQGGLIYYGGMIASCLTLVIFSRVKHEKTADVFDLVTTAVPLAHAFGRLGCFFNGCCHGKIYSGPLAVTFPSESPPWWSHVYAGRISQYDTRSLGVHPLQIYEALFNLALYALLIVVYKRRKNSGIVAATYLLVYPVGRYFLEFLRGDERMMIYGLTTAQALSACLFAAGIFLAWRVKRKHAN